MPFDCELIRDGLLAQPANTLSSLAFLVAAVVVRGDRLAAVALALAGIGSAMFHGSPGTWSSVMHDLGVLALVVAVGRSLWVQRQQPRWYGVALLVGGLVLWFTSRTGGPLCDPATVVQGHAVWHVVAAIAIAMIVSRKPLTSG